MNIFNQQTPSTDTRYIVNSSTQRGAGPAKNPIEHALKQVQKMEHSRPSRPKPTANSLYKDFKSLGNNTLRYARDKIPLRLPMGLPPPMGGRGLKLAGQGMNLAGGCKSYNCPSSRLRGRGLKKFIKQIPERLTTTTLTGYPAIIPGTPILSELMGRGTTSTGPGGYALGVLVQRPDQSGTGISLPTFKGIVASGCDWAVGKLVDTLEEMSGYDLSAAEARINQYTEEAKKMMDDGEAGIATATQMDPFGADPFAGDPFAGSGIGGDIRKELKKLVPRFRKDIGQYALMAANKLLPKLGLDPRENPGVAKLLRDGIGRISRQAISGQKGEGFMKSLKNLGKKIVKGLKKGSKAVKKFIANNPELMTGLQTAGAVAPALMML